MSEPQDLRLDGTDWTLYPLPPGQWKERRIWEQEPPEAGERRPVPVPDLSAAPEGDAIYEKRFHLPGELDGFFFHLHFAGVSGAAYVYLNGNRVGAHRLPFAAVEWDVSELVRPGQENHLLVVVEPGQAAGEAPERLGLTEGFVLRATGPAWYRSVSIHATLSLDFKEAAIAVVSEFNAVREIRGFVRAEITQDGLPTTTIEDAIHLRPGDTSLVQSGVIPRVRHWQPNGSGPQPLYQARLTLVTDMDDVLDHRTVAFGVRQVDALPCEDAPPGSPPYVLSVNGRKTWIKGCNWIPLANSTSGASRNGADQDAEYARLLQLAKAAHINLLRVCGDLETETFYRLCDRLGIMVWQEFPTRGALPSDPEGVETLRLQAEGILPRRRNHPSLVLWSGARGVNTSAGEPPALAELRASVELDDPQRLWLPSSPTAPVTEPDPRHRGELQDVHGPWHFLGLREQPEFFDTVDPLLHSAFSAVADSQAVAAAFGGVEEGESRNRAAALLSAMGLQYAVEANRRRQWHCAGTLPWVFNGAESAALVSASGAAGAGYSSLQRAYRPFHVSAAFRTFTWSERPQFQADIWLHNSGPERSLLNVVARVVDLSGRELYQENLAGEAPENGGECVGDLAWRFPREFAAPFLLLLEVIDEEGDTLARNHYLHSRAPEPAFAPFLTAPPASVKISAIDEGVEVRNTGGAVALGVRVEWGQSAVDTILLLEDNDFPLFPGEARRLRITPPQREGWTRPPVTVAAWNAPLAAELSEVSE